MKITTQKNKKTPSGGRLSNNDSNSFTRECIHGAMIYLAQNKPFDKITITELAKKRAYRELLFTATTRPKKTFCRKSPTISANAFGTPQTNWNTQPTPIGYILNVFTG